MYLYRLPRIAHFPEAAAPNAGSGRRNWCKPRLALICRLELLGPIVGEFSERLLNRYSRGVGHCGIEAIVCRYFI